MEKLGVRQLVFWLLVVSSFNYFKMHAWYTSMLSLLHSAFMLNVVKMLLKGEVGGCALNSHGNSIVDLTWKIMEKSWNCVFEILWEQCCLLITFANSLDPDQDRHNVGPDLDPSCLTI